MDGIGCGGVVVVGYHNVDDVDDDVADDFDDNLLDQHHWSNQTSDHHPQSLDFVVD
jgi:hypothetical protein